MQHRTLMWQVGKWFRVAAVATLVCGTASVFVWIFRIGGPSNNDTVLRLTNAVTIAGFALTVMLELVRTLGGIRSLSDTSPSAIAAAAAALATEVRNEGQNEHIRLLGKPGEDIDVSFDVISGPAPNVAGRPGSRSLKAIAAFYNGLDTRRLVVVGPPGSGKTVLIIKLALDLLTPRADGEPVPIRLSPATGWSDAETMEVWIARQLADTLSLSPPLAEALVADRQILPVFDGIDELDPKGSTDRACKVIAELNSYRHGSRRAPIVVSCRADVYEELCARGQGVKDATVIHLNAVSPDAAIAYLEKSTVAADVLSAMRSEDSILSGTLTTPWSLALTSNISAEDGDELRRLLQAPNGVAVSDVLLDNYVALHAKKDVKRAEKWLRTLAIHLEENVATRRIVGGRILSGSDIVLHRLWPIAGSVLPRIIDLLLCLLMSLPALAWAGFLAYRRGAPWVFVFGLVLLAYLAALVRASTASWLEAHRIDIRLISFRSVSLQLLLGGFAGLLAGLLFSFGAGLVVGVVVTIVSGLSTRLRGSLVARSTISAHSPTSVLREDYLVSQVSGILGGSICGLAFSTSFGSVRGMTLGLVYGLMVGATVASGAWRRYLVMLICTRGRLPLRLSSFLSEMRSSGVLRISGIAYQFRHVDLQRRISKVCPMHDGPLIHPQHFVSTPHRGAAVQP
ncbi:NACHT domain-containing protein [Flindersiella endophytica]